MTLRILLAIVSACLTGCATPVLEIEEPTETQFAAAEATLESPEIDPPRNLAAWEMTPAVNRVLPRVRASAYEVCKSLELEDERCNLMLTAEVTVYAHNREINAYADQWDSVGVFGGLIKNVGNDADIAAVLAHELSHIMYGHVEMKTRNALLGAALLGGFAAASQSHSDYYDGDVVADAAELGANLGSLAYSPEMEIEADRTAIYILHHAGFPATSMRDTILHMNRADAARREESFGIFSSATNVGFLQTHPSSDRRVAHILAAIEDVEAGVALKVADK